ncbi:M23 family metallopeptidase [Sedimenticola selenatireducens]|uniref:M23 family metallopeptidase n=1 Tax=Sedimenticola selenatireducens TaxID=191960 RepID=UPI0004917B11|nr:M23 family metallopeptidase [Sedimenticola selenatireducens]
MKPIAPSLSSLLIFCMLLFSSPGNASHSLEGNYVQGGLVVGQTEPGVKVQLDDIAVRVSDQGYFVLGFDRDHAPESRLRLTYPDGHREEQTLKIARREYNIQRIDNLPKRKVTPEKMDLERIRRESALVKAARKRDDPRTDYLSGWEWPVKGRISGVYGSQRILNGQPRRPHFGVDVAAPVGTLVRAPADGIVTLVHPDMFFSGGTLILDHGQHLSSSFLHLSEILVKEGDRIGQGEPIARVGATGRVTGAHLDWRMNFHQYQIDPQLLVPPMEQ